MTRVVTANKVAERVARGAAWLDEQKPGWPQLITEELEMSGCRSCVLGQVFAVEGGKESGYWWALDSVGWTEETGASAIWDWASYHGFEGPEYVLLEEEWLRVIGERIGWPL